MERNLIGRSEELSRLEKTWNRDRFEFVVIYGRRRVGKSFIIDFLLQERMVSTLMLLEVEQMLHS